MGEKFTERTRAFCALGGAVLTTVALPGIVPILHSAMGCGSSIYWNQIGSTGHLGSGYCGGLAIPSSNVQEKEIVFGGTERLVEQIENTLKLVEGELYFVLSGCMTDIIGDDVQSAVRQFQQDNKQVIFAETGGFKGDSYKGYDLVLQALFRDYLNKKEEKIKGKVNLWGIVPGQDAFWRGNLKIIRNLLENLGLEVNSFFTQQDSLAAVKDAATAEWNIVVSQFYGVEAAEVFQEVHGVPFTTFQLPIGPTATEDFLLQVAEILNIPSSVVQKVIAQEKKSYYSYIERIADSYNDQNFQRYTIIVGDGNYGPSLTKFLADDLGWLTELTVITESFSEEKEEKINNILRELKSGYKTNLVFEKDATKVQNHLNNIWPPFKGQQFYEAFAPAFIVGSHLERVLAKNIGAGHLTVTYPVGNRVVLNRGYVGYEGSLHLIEDIFSVLVAER